jgi:CheY-like chemotaxis protein
VIVKNILIADDNRDFSSTLKLTLEAEGYSVYLAANGREAVLVQRKTPADVLITDLAMPDSDGFEAIDAFRKEFPATKVVVVSGAKRLDAPLYLKAAELMGAHAAFRKPFDVELLLKALKALAP